MISYQIACIQTQAGAEARIAKHVTQFFVDRGVPCQVLKCIGSFDLLAIYPCDSLIPLMSEAGHIEGIFKTNYFSCFAYRELDELFSDAVPYGRFFGFTFVKLASLLHAENLADLPAWRLPDAPNVHIHKLWSIGWSELIFLSSASDPALLLDAIFNKPAIHSLVREPIKSFSFLAINVYAGMSTAEEALTAIDTNESLRLCVGDSIGVQVRVSCSPHNERRVISYWADISPIAGHLLGRYDLSIPIPPTLKWNELLSAVLKFRSKFSEDVILTSTAVSLNYSAAADACAKIVGL